MVELKKLSRINDNSDPKKIEKTLTQKFNISIDNTPPDSYQNKVGSLPKLKLHNVSEKKEEFRNFKIETKTHENNSESNYPTIETITPREYVENALRLEVEKKRLEVISNKLQDIAERITITNLENVVEKDTPEVDFLLTALEEKTDKVEDEQPFFESISFLDDDPKIKKIAIKDTGVSHLYAKLDAIETKVINQKKIKKEESQYNGEQQNKEDQKNTNNIYALLEEIEVPEIFSIKDDTNISEAVNKGFSTYEQIPPTKKIRESTFILDNGKINTNKNIDNNISNYKKEQQKAKSEKPKLNIDNYIEDIVVPDLSFDNNEIKEKSLIEEKPNQTKVSQKTSFDYVLPKDAEERTLSKTAISRITKETIDKPCVQQSSSITKVYSVKPQISETDKINISEKYNIDEFTFVNINYMMSQGLVYSVIQPELNQSQEETYVEIKKIFLDSIDSNYTSFKGDKQNLNNYIKKVFDLTIDKLSYNLTDLEKKLYFNFIKRDFLGFGFLSTILEDKNIIEISCSGENMPIIVYHLKYGAIETNLKFENLFKLNQFVLSLTKIMGLQVNSAQPIINGYLPNGYKVEGLYSVGDISNRGSSFIIKKYLEEPLTPVSLINLGIGITDIYSYIWTAMDDDFQILITGGDANLFISALAQFYPDKTITSIQSFDYIKLPQKNWIKKLLLDNIASNKKTIISQTLSQRSDYLILDNFSEDLFDIKWYDFSMVYLPEELLPKYSEKAKAINRKAIIISLERTKINNIEQMQIIKILEISNGKDNDVIYYSKKDSDFKINLESSAISTSEFFNHKKLLRWLVDSGITDGTDFNNIVNDYYNNKKQLLKKLNILE
ncbi:MAG TPA: hypothetical protein PLK55_01195 [archaeon]|jgi:type IV secretory pathway ATPase VirB11/archaellum biosynthesis ATPase|nr:hypothetical protein [archaeon]